MKKNYFLSHAMLMVLLFLSNNAFSMNSVAKRSVTKNYRSRVIKPNNVRRSTCFDLLYCYRCSPVILQHKNLTDFDKELSLCCNPARKIFDILPDLIKQGDSKRVAIALKYDDKKAWNFPENRSEKFDALEKIVQTYYEESQDLRHRDILTQLKNHKLKNNNAEL